MGERDIEDVTVYIVVGQAWRGEAGAGDMEDEEPRPVNILLTAPNDEDAIQRALAALAGEGFGRVELDRIGRVDGEPEDPTFAAAYWNAIDGDVAIIAFHG
jgi:hypothetical protein